MKNSHPSEHAEWAAFLRILEAAPERLRQCQVDPDEEQIRLESYKYLLIGLCQGIYMTQFTDPDFPVWVPNAHFPLGYAGPNPDLTYYYTQVNPAGVYRLWGRRNSVRFASMQVGTDWFGVSYLPEHDCEQHAGRAQNARPLATYDFDGHIQCDADGSFELILSAERPADWTGNWWHMPPESCSLITRFFAYDIANEVDPEIHIERLDGPARPKRAGMERYKHGIKAAAHIGVEMLAFFAEQIAKQRRELGENTFRITTFGGAGFNSQAYLQAPYVMNDDEVLIVETDIPQHCFYWNFQLTDELFSLFDYVNVQNSLNGFSAHIDSDGRFRAVVSSRDPGVHNWLDACDRNHGAILGRWTRADSHPLPVIKRVKFADLKNHLPADTRYVTGEERTAALRRRRHSYLKRFGM